MLRETLRIHDIFRVDGVGEASPRCGQRNARRQDADERSQQKGSKGHTNQSGTNVNQRKRKAWRQSQEQHVTEGVAGKAFSQFLEGGAGQSAEAAAEGGSGDEESEGCGQGGGKGGERNADGRAKQEATGDDEQRAAGQDEGS